VIVLGIDTATPALSTALVGPGGTLADFEAEEGRRHTELLAPAIERICRAAGLSLADVDAIAVDVGPGLFTGLRVGLATAAALASALDRPAIGLTSTDILAEACRPARAPRGGPGQPGQDSLDPAHRAGPPSPLVTVVDVRRSEVAWAAYDERGQPSSPPALASPEALRQVLGGLAAKAGEVLVVGDGARRYRGVLEGGAGEAGGGRIVVDTSVAHPAAADAGALAAHRLLARETVPGRLSPLYLRQADVRIGWERHDLPEGATTHSAGPAGDGRP
jgi:tRNA threonylcarbamoyladenosine biosynthesis protein TsaB